MVWGMISYKGAGQLHICEGMMNGNNYRHLLQTSMLPQAKAWFPSNRFIFMHDGAPCHKAKLIIDYFHQQRVTLLPWPGNSPELNPIENIWSLVKQLMSEQTIKTRREMIVAVNNVCMNDPGIKEAI
jgi:hypothetical protein